MNDSMAKSLSVTVLWMVGSLSPQAFFSIMTSVAATIYFGAMLKINVVDRKYDRSWWKFFKSWFK